MREPALVQGVEEVALVLAGVEGFGQARRAVATGDDARVMPGCHELASQLVGHLEEAPELEVAVAQHAGVGREPRFIRRDEPLDDVAVEFCSAVDDVVLDAEVGGERRGVADVALVVAAPRGVSAGGAAVVEAHGRADAFVALFHEHVRGDARIDAAAHGDKDAVAGCWGVGHGGSHSETCGRARRAAGVRGGRGDE